MTTRTPEEARTQIVNMVRDFVRRDVEPVADHLDHEDIVPHDLIDKMKISAHTVRAQITLFRTMQGWGV